MFDLNRFIEAQETQYEVALEEIKDGFKSGHWMWYIFPQIAGLGYSHTSQYYAIKDLEEAKAYLNHEILGNRLREISEILLTHHTSNARDIFGRPDDVKLHSSMTLFAIADSENPGNVFERVLAKFFNGKSDLNTLAILNDQE